ncbi:dynein regulatory complex protein 10-like [Rhopilema esculentum]|uniref:dynein regulatory complex protein 10-like n=1 Tax=Rhopilema esculentum TaxID=499914 RepID=UPI0031DD61B5
MAAATFDDQRGESNSINLLSNGIEDLQIKAKQNKKKGDNNNEFLKSLEPGRRKLSSVESQRVVSVIDDCIRKVEIVTLLPYILENIKRFSVLLGSELVSLIEEYDIIENKYRRASKQYRKTLRQNSEVDVVDSQSEDGTSRPESQLSQVSDWLARAESDELRQTVDILQENLKGTIKSIVRYFGKNPSALKVINAERKERPYEANNMIDGLYSLKDLVFLRLVTSPGEELERVKQFVDLNIKERKAQATINKLGANLDAAIKDKDNEIDQLNDTIKNLKTSIHNVEKNSEDQNHRIIADAAKAESGELKNSDGKKAKLQQEIIQLKQALQSNLSSHRESELALRKRKYKMETEVENWVQKFDNDMSERQDEFDELDAIYTEEKRQLKELEEKFKTLEEEYTQIMEERRIAKERREAAERELRSMIKAATVIQSFWRAYKMRKALKSKKKKGKKGKKGKGRKKR